MGTIEDIILGSDPTNDLKTGQDKIRMSLQCEKTRFICNEDVEAKLRILVDEYFGVIEDGDKFSYDDDWKPIAKHVAAVAQAMKLDLETHLTGQASRVDKQSNPNSSASQINSSAPNQVQSPASQNQQAVSSSIASFAPNDTDKIKFLSQCDASERTYFETVINHCEAHKDRVTLVWGTKGVSIKDQANKPLVWMFPTRTPKWNIQFIPKSYKDEERVEIEKILPSPLANLISYKPSTLPLNDLTRIINLIAKI